eukprot:SAG31_NODE_13280_length_880_cov_0.701665_1_plen_251_part_01
MAAGSNFRVSVPGVFEVVAQLYTAAIGGTYIGGTYLHARNINGPHLPVILPGPGCNSTGIWQQNDSIPFKVAGEQNMLHQDVHFGTSDDTFCSPSYVRAWLPIRSDDDAAVMQCDSQQQFLMRCPMTRPVKQWDAHCTKQLADLQECFAATDALGIDAVHKLKPANAAVTNNLALSQGRHGLFLHPRLDLFIGASLRIYGEWSELEVQSYARIIQPGDVVINGGGHVGSMAVPLASLAAPGCVHVFEPQRR